MVLVPDFKPTFTIAPGFQPYSAEGFCSVLNSWIESTGRIEVASPKTGDEFNTLWEEKPSTVSIPFRMYTLCSGRIPFELWLHLPLPGWTYRPGCRSSRRLKLRPLRGRSLINWLLRAPPRVAVVVWICGISSVTVMV